MFLHIKENELEKLIRTIYKRIQMNLIVHFKGNSAKRHACASSNICRLLHTVTIVVSRKRPKFQVREINGLTRTPGYT
jgi:hypothetical protein